MGKSNRIKANRAVKSTASFGAYKKNEGMPNWAVNLIAIVLTLAILLGGVALVLSSNGTIMRMRTAARSEHFRVNGQVMTYFANSKYQNFVSQYSAYMSLFSLDTSKPLKTQAFGDTTANPDAMDATILGEFEGTWYDYFMSEAKAEVENMLLYCEEAYAMGVSLDDADQKKIDDAIAEFEKTAAENYYATNAYLSAIFGNAVKVKDVRRAMELSELATKGMNAISDKLLDNISAERVNAAYNEDPLLYNCIDYTFYGFRIDYEDVSDELKKTNPNATEADILAAYVTRVNETKTKAEALSKIAKEGTLEELERAILRIVAEENYDAAYKKQSKPSEGLTDEQIATIREQIIAEAVKAAIEGSTPATEVITKTEDGKYVGYDIEMSEAWANVFNTITKDGIKPDRSLYVKDTVKYLDSDKFSTWAFDAERKVDDTNMILNGDGSEEGEIKNSSGYFRADIYRLRKTQYADPTKTKNIAYMVFSSESEATAAIDALKAAGTVDQTTFDRIAAEKVATSNILENYVKGDMGNTDFDNWVFADGRVIGNYTDKAIKLGDSSYAVLYYTADGQEAWYVGVQDDLFNEDFEAYFANMEQTITLNVKANVIKKVKIGAY